MAQRDLALINILERLAEEMTQQDAILEELLKGQSLLAEKVESAGLHLRGGQTDAQRSYDTLGDAISRYRSDMLSLVGEQDRINRNVEDLRNTLKATTYTLDITKQKLIEMEERLSLHEKTSSEFYEHALKQPQLYKEALDGSVRSFTKLHADTEKHLTQLQGEMALSLDKFSSETLRRLLLLDGVTTSLQTLLARTEPPEKRPPWVMRSLRKVSGFFRRIRLLMWKKRDK